MWDKGYTRSMGNMVKPKRGASPMSMAAGCCTNDGKKQGGQQTVKLEAGTKRYRPPSKRPAPKG